MIFSQTGLSELMRNGTQVLMLSPVRPRQVLNDFGVH